VTNDIENAAWGTWADELNAALHPLGILLDGVGAATILDPLKNGSVLETIRAATEDDVRAFAEAANRFVETDTIKPSHIREAIDRTKWHWEDV